MPTSPGPLMSALDGLWDRLQTRNPLLPPARLAVSPTPRLSGHGPERWAEDDEGYVTGLVVNVETLRQGAEAVLELVLHDAAHMLNWRRDVRDTTMRGVYHNQEFLAAAEDMGLCWPEGKDRIKGKGYSDPVLSDAALKRHVDDLAALAEAIPLVLPHLEVPTTSRAGRTDRLTLRCKCVPQRTFRISRTIAAQGPITCGVCGEEFTEE